MTTKGEKKIFEFVKQIPKVELHAHLNGCIRETTLFELAKERKIDLNEHLFSEEHSYGDHSMYNVRPRSLNDCFEMFAEVSKCVDDLGALERITKEALEDFAAHHVAYLELRSTPKRLLEKSGTTNVTEKMVYCRKILDCMQEFAGAESSRYAEELLSSPSTTDAPPRFPMSPRFIVAIDRSHSVDEGYEHVEIAKALREEYGEMVVGVDLGGNPTKNQFEDYRGVFESARESGLKTTIHCGEIACRNEDQGVHDDVYLEAKSILEFGPDRLGHALLLPPSLQKMLLEKKIPVESCPTSNVMTLELANHHSGNLLEGLKAHPQLAEWIKESHPFSIGTDDPGVFNTNITKELVLLQKAFDIPLQELGNIMLSSMDHAFCSDITRNTLKLRLLERVDILMKTL